MSVGKFMEIVRKSVCKKTVDGGFCFDSLSATFLGVVDLVAADPGGERVLPTGVFVNCRFENDDGEVFDRFVNQDHAGWLSDGVRYDFGASRIVYVEEGVHQHIDCLSQVLD